MECRAAGGECVLDDSPVVLPAKTYYVVEPVESLVANLPAESTCPIGGDERSETRIRRRKRRPAYRFPSHREPRYLNG
jgi:hypothetical protein